MPRYFFDIRDGQPILVDNIGIDLPNLEAAIEEAYKEADLVVGGLIASPDMLHDLQVHIIDVDGNVLKKIDLPDLTEFAR
jgi:hypothetical protein